MQEYKRQFERARDREGELSQELSHCKATAKAIEACWNVVGAFATFRTRDGSKTETSEQLVDDVRILFQDLPSTSQGNGANHAGSSRCASCSKGFHAELPSLEPFPPLPLADLPALDAALQERIEQTKQLLSRLLRSVPVEAEDLRQQCLRLTHEVRYSHVFPKVLHTASEAFPPFTESSKCSKPRSLALRTSLSSGAAGETHRGPYTCRTTTRPRPFKDCASD
jgi:hypothetical protein